MVEAGSFDNKMIIIHHISQTRPSDTSYQTTVKIC